MGGTMNETTRFYVIVTTMRYLLLIPDMTIEMAYELSENLYNETYSKMKKILTYQILNEI
jgi:hypothetical protein